MKQKTENGDISIPAFMLAAKTTILRNPLLKLRNDVIKTQAKKRSEGKMRIITSYTKIMELDKKLHWKSLYLRLLNWRINQQLCESTLCIFQDNFWFGLLQGILALGLVVFPKLHVSKRYSLSDQYSMIARVQRLVVPRLRNICEWLWWEIRSTSITENSRHLSRLRRCSRKWRISFTFVSTFHFNYHWKASDNNWAFPL